MAAGATPRKQAKALLFLALLAVGQVDAVSNMAAAAGIATLAIAARGARDDGSRAISVHSAGRQVLASDDKRGPEDWIRAHNASLLEAKGIRDCLPKDNMGWVKMGIGKGNLYMLEKAVPFVGVVLAADACHKAAQSRCEAGKVLREENLKWKQILENPNKPEDQLEAVATDANILANDEKPTEDDVKAVLTRSKQVDFEEMMFQDISVLQCKQSHANHGVASQCVLGFSMAAIAQGASLATAGASAAVTTPMLMAVDVTKHVQKCFDETANSCHYVEVDGSGDKGKLTSFRSWLSKCSENAQAAARGAMGTVRAAAEEMSEMNQHGGGGPPMV